MSSQKYIDNIDKDYDESNWMYMSDDKDSDERYQISKNNEEKVSDVIEVLKLGKLSTQKNIDNVQKESDENNWMDMSDDKKYDKRDQISTNDEIIVADVIEVLKQGKLSTQKNIDNVDKEYDKRNSMDMIDDE